MTQAPEPKDKLDAATTVVVNGPKDATLDWRQIDWRVVEDSVRRLRQRIFTASQAGDLTRVRKTITVTWEAGASDKAEPRLIHANCHNGNARHFCPPTSP